LDKISPKIVLFLGVLAVSTASPLIRLAQGEVSSLVIAAYRMAFAALILFPLTIPRHNAEIRKLTHGDLALAALSGLLLALHFATWILSLEYTSVASSVVLVTTNPLWVALLAPWLLKERLAPGLLLGMFMALAGGSIVAISDSCQQTASGLACPPLSEFIQGDAFWGDLLALMGAWTGAGYILIGRRLRATLTLTPYVFLVYSAAAVVLIVMVAFSGLPILAFPAEIYGYLLLLAIVPQLLGHSSFNWALGHLPASYVSIGLLGEPIGSTLLAYFVLGEAPGWLKILGAALILCGILYATLRPSSKRMAVYN
jgi:drug/metabolite transporter (DMT)-like permease